MRWGELREHERVQHAVAFEAMKKPGWQSTLERPCSFCGMMVTAATIKTHMDTAHPRIARYVLFVRELGWGTALGWSWGFLVLLVLYALHALSDFQILASMATLTAFLVIVAAWLPTFALRHLLRLRSAWNATNPPKG